MKGHKPGVRDKAAPACLHCYVIAALDAYCEETGRVDPETGSLVYEVPLVLGNLADVVAEFLAGQLDRGRRRQLRREFDAYLTKRTAECAAQGRHPPMKTGTLQ